MHQIGLNQFLSSSMTPARNETQYPNTPIQAQDQRYHQTQQVHGTPPGRSQNSTPMKSNNNESYQIFDNSALATFQFGQTVQSVKNTNDFGQKVQNLQNYDILDDLPLLL